ncbi:MAG: hypothetical protein ACK2T6_06190 [Anaerolineae bacterium]
MPRIGARTAGAVAALCAFGALLAVGGWEPEIAHGSPRGAPQQEPPLQLTVRPETEAPPPPIPTRGPTEPPAEPTAEPPTTAPTQAPQQRDDDRDRRRDDESGQPAAPVLQAPTGEITPTRTRRPTRTPRTTSTPTPTAIPAGALRLILAANPGAPAIGESVELLVVVANRTDASADDLTLQAYIPEALIVEAITAEDGQTASADGVVRWYVPRLMPGDDAVLRLRGVVSSAPEAGLELCALLLSAGAPLEQCARFEIRDELGAASAPGGEPEEQDLESGVATVVPPSSSLPVDVSPTLLGWTVLIAGLAVLGVWLGLVLRGRR